MRIFVAFPVLAAAASSAHAEDVEASALWLAPSYVYEAGGSAPRRAEVAILNLSAEPAKVACYVYTEGGEFADSASQVKTYAAGASRSNEGGALPCAFSLAESLRGWAVIVASRPVVARGFVCEDVFCATQTPMPMLRLDCPDPNFAAACRHAPAFLRADAPGVVEPLRAVAETSSEH
jgi:hypothetical protein